MEIDSETVALLANGAELDDRLVWEREIPVGVSKMEHYAGFAEVVEIAKAVIYNRTQKLKSFLCQIIGDLTYFYVYNLV